MDTLLDAAGFFPVIDVERTLGAHASVPVLTGQYVRPARGGQPELRVDWLEAKRIAHAELAALAADGSTIVITPQGFRKVSK